MSFLMGHSHIGLIFQCWGETKALLWTEMKRFILITQRTGKTIIYCLTMFCTNLKFQMKKKGSIIKLCNWTNNYHIVLILTYLINFRQRKKKRSMIISKIKKRFSTHFMSLVAQRFMVSYKKLVKTMVIWSTWSKMGLNFTIFYMNIE